MGLTCPRVAHAHAVALYSVPADGAVLERAPERIVIRFNEPVVPISARVLDADGKDITPSNAVAMQDRDLRIALPSGLSAGSYVASYRVVSLDSHPISGSVVFSVGKAGTRAPLPAAGFDAAWRMAMLAARSLLYACILGAAGGILFLLLLRPRDAARRATERIAGTFANAGMVAAVLAIGIHGASLAGGPPGVLASAATWRLSLSQSFGQALVVAAGGLALIAVGLWRQHASIGLLLPGIGAAASLVSFALSGHVVSAEPRWLSSSALLLHVTAVAFWLGALLPLHRVVADAGAQAAPLVRRFSRMALGAVPILIAAGLTIAVLQVTSLQALVDTNYGPTLLAKVGLVAGLLAIAAHNKLRVTPALARGDVRAAITLRRNISVEIALACSILAATAALSITPPPRVLHSDADHAGLHDYQEPTGLWIALVNDGRRAQIVFASAHSGQNSVYVRFSDTAGTPLEPKEVTLLAANPAAGVAPIRRHAQATATGAWNVDGLVLVPAGRWSIRIDALVSDFEQVRFETEIELR